jgi:hypothetical protein
VSASLLETVAIATSDTVGDLSFQPSASLGYALEEGASFFTGVLEASKSSTRLCFMLATASGLVTISLKHRK